MISEIRKIEFKEFVRDYKNLETRDKVWLLSLIHNAHSLEYFQIISEENIPVGIGSVSYVGKRKEVSFAIFSKQKLKGYGSCFVGFIQGVFPRCCFKVSQFNTQSMSLFRKSQKRLDLKCSYNKSSYTFFR